MPFCCTTQCIKQHRALQKLKIHRDLIPQQRYKNRSLPTCIMLSFILHRAGARIRPASCGRARGKVPHAKPRCPTWANQAMERVIDISQSRSWWMEPRALRKPFAAVWGWAHFSSSSSRCSTGPRLGSASPCCCYTAVLGVRVVIWFLFLQQPSWRCKIISKIIKHCSQYSSCSKTSSRGNVWTRDPSVRKLTAEADTRRIIGIRQTLKGQ